MKVFFNEVGHSSGDLNSRGWAAGLLVLVAVYVAMYGMFLAEGKFRPFVSDNVETYSAFLHGKNLYERGVGKTFGLTDETYSSDPKVPSVVYTHQGNFPRLFSALLYALGARSIESQILITTLTIGLATVILAFSFFSTISNPLFGFLACLVMISDYVFFMQWQVDTYRVWHGFFLFFALLSVHKIPGSLKRFWIPATVTCFACLFYFELIFAVYVFVLYVVYCAVLYGREQHRLMFKMWIFALVGSLVGVAVLIVQDIAYLSWDGFIADTYYTYVLRNHAPEDGSQLIKELHELFSTKRVIYWYDNVIRSEGIKSLSGFVGYFFGYVLAIFPPSLLIITGLVIGALILRVGGDFFNSEVGKVKKIPFPLPGPVKNRVLKYVSGAILCGLLLPLVSVILWSITFYGGEPLLVFLAFLPLLAFMAITYLFPSTHQVLLDEYLIVAHHSSPVLVDRVIRRWSGIFLSILVSLFPSILLQSLKPAALFEGILSFGTIVHLWFFLFVAILSFTAWRPSAVRHLILKLASIRDRNKKGFENLLAWCSVFVGGVTLLVVVGILCFGNFDISIAPIAFTALTGSSILAFAQIKNTKRVRELNDSFKEIYDSSSQSLSSMMDFILSTVILVLPIVLFPLISTLLFGHLGLTVFFFVWLAVLVLRFLPSVIGLIGAALFRLRSQSKSDPNGFIQALHWVAGPAMFLVSAGAIGVLFHHSENHQVFGLYSWTYLFYLLTVLVIWGFLVLAYFLSGKVDTLLLWNHRMANSWWLKISEWAVHAMGRLKFFQFTFVYGAMAISSTGFFLQLRRIIGNVNVPIEPFSSGKQAFAFCLVSSLVPFIASKLTTGDWFGFKRLGVLRCLLACALMVGGWVIIDYLSMLPYEGHLRSYPELWKAVSPLGGNKRVEWLLLVGTSLLASLLILTPHSRVKAFFPLESMNAVTVFLGCATIGYVFVYFLAPGYILSAYLFRWAFFPAFLFDVAFSVVVYTAFWYARSVVRLGYIVPSWIQRPASKVDVSIPEKSLLGERSRLVPILLNITVSVFMIFLFIGIGAIWVSTQTAYSALLSPRHYEFLEDLGNDPFRNSTFVVNNYAGPVAVYTKAWAYYDPQFANGEVILEEEGFRVEQDTRFAWGWEKNANAVNPRPEYYLCMIAQNPVPAAALRNFKHQPFGCSWNPVLQRAKGGVSEVLQHRLVARDAERDSWAILRLDWKFPPYLVRKEEEVDPIKVIIRPEPAGMILDVEYEYAHQDGEQERGTLVRVYDVGEDTECGGSDKKRELIAEVMDQKIMKLPSSFSGKIRISITPRTSQKSGVEYYGSIIEIPSDSKFDPVFCPYRAIPLSITNPYAQWLKGRSIHVMWTKVQYATEYFIEVREITENEKTKEFQVVGSTSKSSFDFLLDSFNQPLKYEVRVRPCNGPECGNPSSAIPVLRLLEIK